MTADPSPINKLSVPLVSPCILTASGLRSPRLLSAQRVVSCNFDFDRRRRPYRTTGHGSTHYTTLMVGSADEPPSLLSVLLSLHRFQQGVNRPLASWPRWCQRSSSCLPARVHQHRPLESSSPSRRRYWLAVWQRVGTCRGRVFEDPASNAPEPGLSSSPRAAFVTVQQQETYQLVFRYRLNPYQFASPSSVFLSIPPSYNAQRLTRAQARNLARSLRQDPNATLEEIRRHRSRALYVEPTQQNKIYDNLESSRTLPGSIGGKREIREILSIIGENNNVPPGTP